jgi:hypothetical protein
VRTFDLIHIDFHTKTTALWHLYLAAFDLEGLFGYLPRFNGEAVRCIPAKPKSPPRPRESATNYPFSDEMIG